MNLFEFAHYCCDARLYLLAGQSCAEAGNCYEAIRPMGSTFWFSIPYRLGLSPSILVMAHLLLMLASIVLSVFAIRRLYENHHATKITAGPLIFIISGNSLAHIIFLYPVLWVPLSDTPANLLLLIGVWLLLLSGSPQLKRIYLLIVAGLCLGLAAFIRAFFLYPILAALGIWFLSWCFNRRRASHDLAILVILIPILLQTITTFEKTGHFAFLPPDATGPWVETHLNSTITGYDTILPFDYYPWYSSCKHYGSLLESTQHFDLHSVACVLSGKLQFYLGSYSFYTYHPESSALKVYTSYDPDFDLLTTTEGQLINNTEPAAISLNQKTNMIIFPGLKNNLNKVWKPDPSQPGEIVQTVKLERGSAYRASIKFSAPTSFHYMTFGVRDLQKNTIASSTVILNTFMRNNQPCYVETNAIIDRTDLYEIFLKSDFFDKRPTPATAGYTVNKEFFYVWDAQLRKVTKQPLVTRTWSTGLLIANALAFIGALFYFIKNRNLFDAMQTLSFGLLAFCWCESLLIVPEQRFAMTTMISIWIFCIAWIATASKKHVPHANAD